MDVSKDPILPNGVTYNFQEPKPEARIAWLNRELTEPGQQEESLVALMKGYL